MHRALCSQIIKRFTQIYNFVCVCVCVCVRLCARVAAIRKYYACCCHEYYIPATKIVSSRGSEE